MKINIKNLINDTFKNLDLFISKKEEKWINLDNFKKYLKNTEFKSFVLILWWNQIAWSLSPFIHNYWQFLLEQNPSTGSGWQGKWFYILCNLEKYNLKTEEVLDFIKNNENIFWANVTMPYKEDIFEILNNENKLEKIAIEAWAVNTIFKEKWQVFWTNTDVKWIELPVKKLNKENPSTSSGWQTRQTAYILWAWWASRWTIVALKKLWFSEIKIFNRSLKNAEKIKNEFENENFKIEIIEYDLLNSEKNQISRYFDKKWILINTLPFWFKENFPKLIVKNEEFEDIFKNINLYFDIVYDLEKWKTPTIKKAKENFPEIKICDWVDMILNQAVWGFEKWFWEELNIEKIWEIIRK